MFKKYLQLIYLMFSCLNLERNDHYFSDSKEKEGPPNKLVYCYEGWVLTMCQTLYCRALYCSSSISLWHFFALSFDPDSHSTRFTENQLCGATKPHTMGTNRTMSALRHSPPDDKHVKDRPPNPTQGPGGIVWMCFLLSRCLCQSQQRL